jgi:hypothetical protein
MERMQIQLTTEQRRQLKRWAHDRGISLAEAVRRCVAERLAADQATPSRAARVREALAVAGSHRDPEGARDIAAAHDAHLAKAYRR